MYRQAALIFPSLYGPFVASEKRADLFPGVQPLIRAPVLPFPW
jgi:hypothetical protein